MVVRSSPSPPSLFAGKRLQGFGIPAPQVFSRVFQKAGWLCLILLGEKRNDSTEEPAVSGPGRTAVSKSRARGAPISPSVTRLARPLFPIMLVIIGTCILASPLPLALRPHHPCGLPQGWCGLRVRHNIVMLTSPLPQVTLCFSANVYLSHPASHRSLVRAPKSQQGTRRKNGCVCPLYAY